MRILEFLPIGMDGVVFGGAERWGVATGLWIDLWIDLWTDLWTDLYTELKRNDENQDFEDFRGRFVRFLDSGRSVRTVEKARHQETNSCYREKDVINRRESG